MSDLAQLSLQRVRSGLDPIISTFALDGAGLPDRLAGGRAAARRVLAQYVPQATIDLPVAAQGAREIEVWAQQNDHDLSQIFASDASELPEQLVLRLGAERAQQFILAGYAQAVVGLGPWISGAVAARVASGELSEEQMRVDAEQRLQMFALIVQLDQLGGLQQIFLPEAQDGFGLAPVVAVVIVVVAVVIAAAIVSYLTISRRLELANRLQTDICLEAQRSGDRATVNACLRSIQDVQQQKDPLQSIKDNLIGVVAIAGVSYVAFMWGLPWLASRWRQ